MTFFTAATMFWLPIIAVTKVHTGWRSKLSCMPSPRAWSLRVWFDYLKTRILERLRWGNAQGYSREVSATGRQKESFKNIGSALNSAWSLIAMPTISKKWKNVQLIISLIEVHRLIARKLKLFFKSRTNQPQYCLLCALSLSLSLSSLFLSPVCMVYSGILLWVLYQGAVGRTGVYSVRDRGLCRVWRRASCRSLLESGQG